MREVIEGFMNRLAKQWSPPSWRNLLITLPWAIGLVFLLYSSTFHKKIAGREQVAYGTIRTHEPGNHDRFGYGFSVGEKSYTGWQIPTRDYKIGQSVQVFYDPLNPETNSLDSFSEASDQNLGPTLLCASGIVGVAFIIFHMRRKHQRHED